MATIFFLIDGKYAHLWDGPFFWKSDQILSMKPWWKKNSGASADFPEHIVPSMEI